MNDNDYPNVHYLRRLALKVGDVMRRNFGLGMQREWKADDTPLTATDTKINKGVVQAIKRDYPHVRVIGEEGNYEVDDAEYTVYTDPVDGTLPFCHGVPIAAFCIAVVKGTRPLAAVIYDPFQKRLWHATRGGGTLLNDRLVRVSKHATFARSHLCLVWWKGSRYNFHSLSARLMEEGANWFYPQSLAYFGGLVAAGEFEGTLFAGQHVWETAAMDLIITEAGGRVTDLCGHKPDYTKPHGLMGHIASNGVLHKAILRLVKEYCPL